MVFAAGRKVELFVLADFAPDGWGYNESFAEERRLIHELQESQGYLLNNEAIWLASRDYSPRVNRVQVSAYCDHARRFSSGDSGALEIAMQFERLYPTVFHIFQFGDLLSGKAKEPSSRRTRKEAGEETRQGENRRNRQPSSVG